MVDTFDRHTPALDSPASRLASITTDDTTELANATRGIYVGGNGNLKVTTIGGDEVTLTGVIAGMIYPIRAKIVWQNGTTATNLVALW